MSDANIIKYIRISPQMLEFIEAQPGKNFTRKMYYLLQSLCFNEAVENKKEELEKLQMEISDARYTLELLKGSIREMKDINNPNQVL